MNIKFTDKNLIALALLALSVELVFLFSNFHFLYQTPQVTAHLEKIATVLQVSKRARSRSTFQLNWADLKKGETLYEGDEVATGDDSQLSIQFEDGQIVSLGANSLLELKRIRKTSGRSFNLSLLRGKLDVAENDVKKSQLEIQVGSQKLIATGSTAIKVENNALGSANIQVSRGQIPIVTNPEAASEKVSVNVLQRFAELKPPKIKRPSDDSTIELSSSLKSVSLQWEQGEASLGETVIDVAKDPSFSDPLLHKVTSGAVPVDFHPSRKGTYFWRVTRRLGSRQVSSEVASFEVTRKVPAPILSRPKVETGIYPQIHHLDPPSLDPPVIHYKDETSMAGEILNWILPSAQADEGVSSVYSVDLNWQKIDEADGYVIQIAVDPAFKELSLEQTMATNTFTWKTDAPGSYFWRVASVDGDRGSFSEYSTFRIIAQKNVGGDETTYESYALFDDYTKGRSTLSVFLGPQYQNYYFVDTANKSQSLYSPFGVTLLTDTILNIDVSYDYILSPAWSFHSSARVIKNYASFDDFDSGDSQTYVNDGSKKSTTDIFLGIERRFFEPRSYFTLEGGVRAYFAGIVDSQQATQQGAPNNLQIGDYNPYGFFGAYLLASYDLLLGSHFDLNFKGGASFLTSNASSRFSQLAFLKLRKRFSDNLGFGFRFEEELAEYNFRDQQLFGDAHELDLFPEFFVEYKF
jgi:hypothetical protein